MLRPSFARKIARLRTARVIPVRTYYHPIPQYSPLVAPTRRDPYPKQPRTRLYVPEPEVMPLVEDVPEDQDAAKHRLTEAALDTSPEIDERALRDFYTSLMEDTYQDSPSSSSTPLLEAPGKSPLSQGQRAQILERLAMRLQSAQIIPPSNDVETGIVSADQVEDSLEEKIIVNLAKLNVPSSSRVTYSVKGKGMAAVSEASVPMGLLSKAEWDALFETFIFKQDARSAEGVISVMLHHGVQPDEAYIGRVMNLDAYAGRVEEVSRLTSGILSVGGEIPSSAQNAFIASLLIASPNSARSAIQYLRQHELRGDPLPQACYHKVIHHLVTPSAASHVSSHTKAMAWELFAHMRLHAHPIPDKSIYTQMIRVCSDPRLPEPERARDLWIEMTQEGNKVQPTREEYDAIIRALCSTKHNYLEGFELLRQMLSKHHDVVLVPFEDRPKALWSAYVPTRETFAALLEGTKRAGDLERARWILSESIGLTGSSIEVGQPMEGPDEELMAGLFMTYAAWKPTISRKGLRTKKGLDVEAAEDIEGESQLHAENLDKLTGEIAVDDDQSAVRRSTYKGPRSAADAIREATAIFERILEDVRASTDEKRSFFQHPFNGVTLRTRLVNSYLSIHLEHAASTAAAYKAWNETWSQVALVDPSVKPNGWSYTMLLERCAAGRRKDETSEDKVIALAWGKRIWQEYMEWSPPVNLLQVNSQITSIVDSTREQASLTSRQTWLSGLGPRQVEKCWRFAIKIYASTGHTDTALALLREFRRRHPPQNIVGKYEPFELFTLDSRVTDVTKLAEPEVPPHLLFSDLDVLHQRLVRKEDWDGTAKVKFIAKEYEHALVRRRADRVKNLGVAKELSMYKREQKMFDKAQESFKSLPAPAEDDEMDDQWDEFVSERRQAWSKRV